MRASPMTTERWRWFHQDARRPAVEGHSLWSEPCASFTSPADIRHDKQIAATPADTVDVRSAFGFLEEIADGVVPSAVPQTLRINR
jgi:hypothetical protein